MTAALIAPAPTRPARAYCGGVRCPLPSIACSDLVAPVAPFSDTRRAVQRHATIHYSSSTSPATSLRSLTPYRRARSGAAVAVVASFLLNCGPARHDGTAGTPATCGDFDAQWVGDLSVAPTLCFGAVSWDLAVDLRRFTLCDGSIIVRDRSGAFSSTVESARMHPATSLLCVSPRVASGHLDPGGALWEVDLVGVCTGCAD